MDSLLWEKSKFWVDSIFDVGKEKTRARIIPDIRSESFPPWHTRIIEFPTYQLEPEFFQARQRSDRELQEVRFDFTRGIAQGGYYDLGMLRRGSLKIRPGTDSLGDVDFREARAPSPVIDDISVEFQPSSILNQESKRGFNGARLYCFNVGQGDSSLLVLNGNAYLIDTNIYTGKNYDRFIRDLRTILNEEGLGDRIKALVITHKHIDHIRGAHHLLTEASIRFEHFVYNPKYSHSLPTVRDLLYAAEQQIPRGGWVDASRPFQIREGEFLLDFLNPTDSTNTKTVAPDMNDSSIVFTVQRQSEGENRFILTGDASYPVLEGLFSSINPKPSVLSVSHHGSRTGTSMQLRRMLTPEQAHISAGETKNYGHPHQETLDILASFPAVNTVITKVIRDTVVYGLDVMWDPVIVY